MSKKGIDTCAHPGCNSEVEIVSTLLTNIAPGVHRPVARLYYCSLHAAPGSGSLDTFLNDRQAATLANNWEAR